LLALPGAVIGRVLFMQGQFKKSEQLLDQAIPLLEAANNRHEVLFAYMYRGSSRACLGNYSDGLSDLKGALDMAHRSQDQNAEAMAHTGLALVHLVSGKYAEGMESAQTALAVAEKSGDAMFRYSTNSFVAWGLAALGNSAESLEHWSAAREAAKPLGGRLLLGEWFAAIESETWLQSGNAEAALNKAEEALTLAKVAGSAIAEGLAERALGRTLTVIPERASEAVAHLSKSCVLLEKIGAKYDLARATLAQAKAELACSDRSAAAATLKKAVSLAHECNLEAEESAALTLLGEVGDA
jgi:tetratricopeptide (TPR) repeat protein